MTFGLASSKLTQVLLLLLNLSVLFIYLFIYLYLDLAVTQCYYPKQRVSKGELATFE